jgi:hypothetical protein
VKLEKFVKQNTKSWQIVFEADTIDLPLVSSTITNRFEDVANFIERVSKFKGAEFDDWFYMLLKDCQSEEKKHQAVSDNVENIMKYADEYLDSLKIDFSQFVDETKAKKGSILFEADEIEKIIRLSCYMKIYSVISNSQNLELGQKFHKRIYNKLSKDTLEGEIIRKIYDVIQTKTYRYNLTDKFMWEYIKNVQGIDLGAHVIKIFNFIMNNIIVLCEETKNPITYFVGVIDESVKWFLRSVYKDSIIYDDTVATEDIQGVNVDNLKAYSYNDTIGRLNQIAYRKVYTEFENKHIKNIENKMDLDKCTLKMKAHKKNIKFISPLTETLVYPTLSYITHIPYQHFKTITPPQAAYLSFYVQDLLRKTFSGEYEETFKLLSFYPKIRPSMSTTYKIKSYNDYINIRNQIKSFFGFDLKTGVPHVFLCHFIGRIPRTKFVELINEQELAGIPLTQIEKEMIHFFAHMFSGKLDNKFKKMTKIMNADF